MHDSLRHCSIRKIAHTKPTPCRLFSSGRVQGRAGSLEKSSLALPSPLHFTFVFTCTFTFTITFSFTFTLTIQIHLPTHKDISANSANISAGISENSANISANNAPGVPEGLKRSARAKHDIDQNRTQQPAWRRGSNANLSQTDESLTSLKQSTVKPPCKHGQTTKYTLHTELDNQN